MDTDSPREVFFRVASEMFADGNFNWGRVVALFYFASKLVLKVGSSRVVGPEVYPQVCDYLAEVRSREWRNMAVYLLIQEMFWAKRLMA